MVSPTLNKLLTGRSFVLWILWGAMTLSIAIYVVVAYVATQQEGTAVDPAVLGTMQTAMTGVGVAAALASVLLRLFGASDARIRARLTSGAARSETPEGLDEAGARLLTLAPWYFPMFVVQLAINESVAIFGLVLAFMGRDGALILPFAVAAVVLNFMAFPRLHAIVRRGAEILRRA